MSHFICLCSTYSVNRLEKNTNHRKYQCIMTIPENHRVLDILPNGYKTYLTSYLLKFDISQTSIFISNMWLIPIYLRKAFMR